MDKKEKGKRAVIHYFSGTGNTQHAARLLKVRFEEAGYETILNNIEVSNNTGSNIQEVIDVFMFPIYGFALPANMIKYIKRLDVVNKKKAAVISLGGHTGKEEGFEGAAAYQAEALLKRKGYDVFFIDFLAYPENFTSLLNPSDELTVGKIFHETDQKLISMADKLINMQTSIKKCNLFLRLLTGIVNKCFLFIARRFLGKVFIADNSCNACAKCERACPVNTIKLTDHKPRWNWQCVQCNRCINICPRKAIQTSIARLLVLIFSVIPAIILVLDMPKQITEFSEIGVVNTAFKIILMIFLYIGICYVFDKLIYLLEKIPLTRKIFEITYTKNYRRYTAPGFQICRDNKRK